MITFNQDDLKAYLKKKTGYEVISIHTIDNFPMPADMDFKIFGNEGPTMQVSAFYDTSNTQWKDISFLSSETINFSEFIKFIRLKKLHKINKSII